MTQLDPTFANFLRAMHGTGPVAPGIPKPIEPSMPVIIDGSCSVVHLAATLAKAGYQLRTINNQLRLFRRP